MVRVFIKSRNSELLNVFFSYTRVYYKAEFKVIRLPIEKKRMISLRSPHIFKGAKIHYTVEVHKRLVLIDEKYINRFNFSVAANLPPSVSVKVVYC